MAPVMRCVFVVAAWFFALSHAKEACSGEACSEQELDPVVLLQTRISIESPMEAGAKNQEAEDPEVDDGTERRPEKLRNIYEEFEKHSRNVTWLFDHFGEELRSLVPKDLKPASENVSLDETTESSLAAVGAREGHVPMFNSGAFKYCGSSKRFDVAAWLEQSLSIDACYIFSCVEPFKVSGTCGHSFYTNGGGNCKCCDYGSNYYQSSYSNVVYLC